MTAGMGPLSAGARIGEFRIVREIGAGGFGITYLAMDEALAREVALKEYLPREWGTRRADGTIGPRSSASADDYAWGLQRFVDEARALARMDDPGIVRVHRVIEAAGTAYIVMEYVKGDSLADALRRSGPLADTAVRAPPDRSGRRVGDCARRRTDAQGHQAAEHHAAGCGREPGSDRLRSGEATGGPPVAAADRPY